VIARGIEAGGYRGSFLVSGDDGPVGTLALVPQVVDAIGVPVVAAGGIGDGRGLAAAPVSAPRACRSAPPSWAACRRRSTRSTATR
jgi:hypothetical protein